MNDEILKEIRNAAEGYMRCYDEFFPETPEAVGEALQTLNDKIDAFYRLWQDQRRRDEDRISRL